MVIAGGDKIVGVAVVADTTVEARVWCTFVNVSVAVVATEPIRALARVAVVSIDARYRPPGAARV